MATRLTLGIVIACVMLGSVVVMVLGTRRSDEFAALKDRLARLEEERFGSERRGASSVYRGSPEKGDGEGEGKEASSDLELGDGLERLLGELDGRLARLDDRLEVLEVRTDAQEGDPVDRGYTYLTSKSARMRGEGVELLSRFARSDSQALGAIREMLNDPSPEVREEVLEALQDANDVESLPRVLTLMDDSNGEVRADALQTVSDLMDEDQENTSGLDRHAVTDSIQGRLSDGDPDVREAAADVLGELNARGAVPSLVGALSDPEEEVREQAFDSLLEVQDPAARPHLQRLYSEATGEDAVSIAAALRRLGDGAAFEREAARLVEEVHRNPDERARRNAVRALGRYAGEEYREVLNLALDDSSRRVRDAAKRAIRHLAERESSR